MQNQVKKPICEASTCDPRVSQQLIDSFIRYQKEVLGVDAGKVFREALTDNADQSDALLLSRDPDGTIMALRLGAAMIKERGV